MKSNLAVAEPKSREESPNERFVRLAIYRMSHLERVIGQVINLAGSSYHFTPEQAEKIVNTVFRLAHAVKAAFEKTGKERKGFSF